jgi:hypothetical protein
VNTLHKGDDDDDDDYDNNNNNNNKNNNNQQNENLQTDRWDNTSGWICHAN